MTPAEIARHIAQVNEQGFTVVENAIEGALLDELATALERLEAELEAKPATNLFEGVRTVRIYNLLARGDVFGNIPVHDEILPIVEGVLDRGCLVSSLSSIAIGPGESAQPVHADDMLIPLPRPHVPLVCNTMWALTDFTDANGATRVIPKSHLSSEAPQLGHSYDTVPCEMKRGSVLIFNGSIWHGGGANTTDKRRIGIAMNYCAGWIRQQENQQLGIPLAIAKTFSPRLRKLVGYGIYRGLLGHIDKCSPVDLLDGVGPRPIIGV